MKSAVILKSVSKKYPGAKTPALDHVSVSFEAGKIHSIIGRSGAGKTTLIRCLNFLEPFDSGDLEILGHDTAFMSPSSRRLILKEIGSIFQQVNLLSRRTALENVMLPQEWQGIAYESAKIKARAVLDKVGLRAFADRYPSQLSGGQQQRVAIARALANDAKILLCDEFTSALDPETSLEILGLLRQLNKYLGVTIILITHDMNVVREVSDFVYVMDQGKIVEQNDVEQVLLHPQHITTKNLLAGLFVRELPHNLKHSLLVDPCDGQIVIRLIFSGKSSQNPIIADLIQQHNIPINILAGSMDHLRETVFGTMLISASYNTATHDLMMGHFAKNGISAEIIGYLPSGALND